MLLKVFQSSSVNMVKGVDLTGLDIFGRLMMLSDGVSTVPAFEVDGMANLSTVALFSSAIGVSGIAQNPSLWSFSVKGVFEVILPSWRWRANGVFQDDSFPGIADTVGSPELSDVGGVIDPASSIGFEGPAGVSISGDSWIGIKRLAAGVLYASGSASVSE